MATEEIRLRYSVDASELRRTRTEAEQFLDSIKKKRGRLTRDEQEAAKRYLGAIRQGEKDLGKLADRRMMAAAAAARQAESLTGKERAAALRTERQNVQAVRRAGQQAAQMSSLAARFGGVTAARPGFMAGLLGGGGGALAGRIPVVGGAAAPAIGEAAGFGGGITAAGAGAVVGAAAVAGAFALAYQSFQKFTEFVKKEGRLDMILAAQGKAFGTVTEAAQKAGRTFGMTTDEWMAMTEAMAAGGPRAFGTGNLRAIAAFGRGFGLAPGVAAAPAAMSRYGGAGVRGYRNLAAALATVGPGGRNPVTGAEAVALMGQFAAMTGAINPVSSGPGMAATLSSWMRQFAGTPTEDFARRNAPSMFSAVMQGGANPTTPGARVFLFEYLRKSRGMNYFQVEKFMRENPMDAGGMLLDATRRAGLAPEVQEHILAQMFPGLAGKQVELLRTGGLHFDAKSKDRMMAEGEKAVDRMEGVYRSSAAAPYKGALERQAAWEQTQISAGKTIDTIIGPALTVGVKLLERIAIAVEHNTRSPSGPFLAGGIPNPAFWGTVAEGMAGGGGNGTTRPAGSAP